MKLGIIARMDKSGLGNQTRNLVYMLNPKKVLVIDSTPFSKGADKKQFPGMYKNYNAFKSYGFLKPRDSINFLRGIDTLLSCELFYGDTVINDAKRRGVKTFLQHNYEFLGNLENPRMPVPDVFLSPSYWKLDEMKKQFPNTVYLPPPIDENAFTDVAKHNMNVHSRPVRILHIVGNPAIHDRNGTNDLLQALPRTSADFELHIKAQKRLDINVSDSRVKMDYSNPDNEVDLYRHYDAIILPRRYAGLCLPMNEALMSGLPVIMTDIEPNNKVLPQEWLVHARKKYDFMSKTTVDVYESDIDALAQKIDWLCDTDLAVEKRKAYDIAMENYSFEALKPKYMEVLKGEQL